MELPRRMRMKAKSEEIRIKLEGFEITPEARFELANAIRAAVAGRLWRHGVKSDIVLRVPRDDADGLLIEAVASIGTPM
jgi:hypothetical protein